MADTLGVPRTFAGKTVFWPHESSDVRIVGGKAAGLAALADARLPECAVPRWFVVAASAALYPEELGRSLERALARLAPNGELVAVRSSAIGEDGANDSYAGQLDSHLFVAHEDVAARIRDVWQSAHADRVGAYEAARGRHSRMRDVAVIVQLMVHADAAGVAFSADPVTGQRGVAIVAAARGVSAALVHGDTDADEWRIDRGGRIVEQRMHGATSVLEQDAVVRVAAAVRAAARHFGAPQDIEWAWEDGRLFVLQSRPVTSLRGLADPDGVRALWDNSNIAESYGGVTTPLTYSFARHAYEQVYRRFLLLLGVRREVVDANADALRRMIGLVRGRVYYNLSSWYRALALLPGYALNRPFMEQMMGVRADAPAEQSAGPSAQLAAPALSRVRAIFDLARATWGLLREHRRISGSVKAFHALVDSALAAKDVPLDAMRPDELAAHYRELESELLARWDAPLLNDFFAMVHFGTLRALSRKWCADDSGTLPNDLVAGEGGMISAKPARLIARMSARVAAHPEVARVLATGSVSAGVEALRTDESLYREYMSYIARFGDRCAEELKLETRTLSEDPLPLLRAIGLGSGVRSRETAGETSRIRADAEARVARALRGHPLRRVLFAAVTARARARVRDRENLRFERTRVFGRVRRIVLELGKRFAAAGLLQNPRDVFYLEIHEVLGAVEGTASSVALDALALARRREFAGYAADAAPADRFETRGMVHEGNRFAAAERTVGEPSAAAEMIQGTGCYPGIVRGVVRVVHDPRDSSLRDGEILVAERTDPGWIMLFPRAAGLLVERGSLLSHSAIVSRELGIPSIVAIPHLTAWLQSGDIVEMDGRSGTARIVERRVTSGAGSDHAE